MAKYHINPETKEVGKCIAEIRCKYGSDAPHYENIYEAHLQAEKELESKYGNFSTLEKSHSKEDFSQKIPAGAPLSVYIDEGDQIKYNDNIYTVKDFYYERALLGYIIDTEEEGEIKVDDYDWYHSSKISVLKDKKKNAQFKSSYYSPDEFNIPADAENLAVLDYDLERGMTIKLNNDLLTVEDFYSSNTDDGEHFMVIKSREYGPVEVREEDIPNIRFYGGSENNSENYTEIDYDEPLKEEFAEPISQAHRNWRSPDEYFNEGDYISYEGEIQKIENITSEFNDYSEYTHTITTNKDKIEINDWAWKDVADLDISIVKNSSNADLLNQFPPGHTGAQLSDYVSNGDSIEYNGETYEINDFEYNRALLSYELETDKGTIYIHDDDWYHDSKIKIVK